MTIPTDITIATPPQRVADEAFLGRAVSMRLSDTPDDEWRAAFSRHEPLARYFARWQFEGSTLVLYLLSGTASASTTIDALDAVKQAIEQANVVRRAAIEREAAQTRAAVEAREQANAEIDSALSTWADSRLGAA